MFLRSFAFKPLTVSNTQKVPLQNILHLSSILIQKKTCQQFKKKKKQIS